MRRREISPEFWTDEKVVALSDPAKLFFIGLLQVADRQGRMLDRPMAISMRVRPWDASSGPALLAECLGQGLVRRYVAVEDGESYLWLPRFTRWQHPHPREQPSRIPAHPDEKDLPSREKDRPGREKDLPSREKDRPGEDLFPASRAGSSGSSGPSGSTGPSGSSGPSGSGGTGQGQSLDLLEDDDRKPKGGRKPSPWEALWHEKLKLDRLVQIARNQNSKVEDPDFDVQAYELEISPATLNTLLKKVAADLDANFGERRWTLEERIEAVEKAWSEYLAGGFGASVEPPYALNAFASPKTSVPCFRRAQEAE